ncbi:MAG: DcrB-related protein [Deltaproteobacteria bacterium]|nr:DcrB-related protein [Deltaproteobacteria bacterium]
MGKIVMNDFEVDLPATWKDQGMITLTMPSTDKKVRPNIIITKERLNQPVDLAAYFEKIKKSVQARGIESFEILEEKDIRVSGVQAKQMICTWDLSAMKKMMGPKAGSLEHIQPGQMVQQIQVSFIRGDQAINLTASFPAEQFDIYSRPFQKFVEGFRFIS